MAKKQRQRKKTAVVKKNKKKQPLELDQIAQTLWKFAPDAIAVSDKEGIVLAANPAYFKLYGFNAKEIIGKDFLVIFPEDQRQVARERYRQVFSSTKPSQLYISTIQRKNGGTRVVESHIDFIKKRGKKVAMISIIQDVTQEKKTQDQLLKNKEELQVYRDRLEHAQSAGNIGIFEWDMRDNTLWWSDVEEQLFGVPQGTFDEVFQHIHLDDRKRVAQEVKTAITEKKDFESEFRVVHADGSIHWLQARGHLSYDSQGKATRMIGVNHDITDRKQLEESLSFKAEASKIFSSSLDYQTTLESVAKLAVPRFADWCAVDMLDEYGLIHLVAVAHVDPKKVKWAHRLRTLNPPDMSQKQGLPNVLRTGKLEFYPHLTHEIIQEMVKDEKQLRIIKQIGGLSSVIIVPITVQHKTIGAITFITTNESKKRYTKADLQMADQLASRASLAIENAKLYKEVNRERERLINLVSNVPGIVWEAWGKPDKSTQRIDFVSSYVEEMLGYTVEEWVKTPNFWLTIVYPEDKERAAKEATQIFGSGKKGVSRFRWIKKNGKQLWVEAHSFVIKDEKGNPIGMRGVTMDISERMALERRKDEFISVASHELKTPLTSMKAFTQLLDRYLKKQQDEIAITYIGKTHTQLDRLTNLVNDLLDVSKIEAGKLIFNKELFDIDEFISNMIEEIQPTTKTHQIQHEAKAKSKVVADKFRIGQVITNLLTNAIKYSPSSDKVIVRTTVKGDYIQVAVQDFGVGVPQDLTKKIFNRFYRVEGRKRESYPGLGLGLFISSEIVRRHNGSIGVDSSEGKGSTFYFTLPVCNEYSPSVKIQKTFRQN